MSGGQAIRTCLERGRGIELSIEPFGGDSDSLYNDDAGGTVTSMNGASCER
jgi:hypothetical protein